MSLRTKAIDVLYRVAFLLVLAVVGCGHTRTIGDSSGSQSDETRAREPNKQDEQAKNKAAVRRKDAQDVRSDKQAVRAENGGGKVDKPGSDEGGPPLATSPAGLLKEGAAESIQDKLMATGFLESKRQSKSFDEPTREALRAFQKDKKFPATGMPDDATVQALGLKPADIFRSATDEGKPTPSATSAPADDKKSPGSTGANSASRSMRSE